MLDISINEVVFSSEAAVDPVGQVFFWRNRVLRGIYQGAVSKVTALIRSGLIEELSEKHLFPKTWVADIKVANFAMVVEHEALPFVTYPHEWSFEMLRKAAVSVLEVNEIARKYEYQLQDCHGYNVIFNGLQPMYIDLGSFIKSDVSVPLLPVEELLRTYWYPLKIWSDGHTYLAKRIISSNYETLTFNDYHLYQNPLARYLSQKQRLRLFRRYESELHKIANRLPGKLPYLPGWVISLLPAECLIRAPRLLKEKFLSLTTPDYDTYWSNYHDEYLDNGQIQTSPRMARILQIVQDLPVESMVELAGNKGLLSLLILNHTQVNRVVSTDYDPVAVNWLYNYCCNHACIPEGKTLLSGVLDFIVPVMDGFRPTPAERLRADLVTALAVTHHLTLTQGFPIRYIMKCIAAFTNNYALVEFMPLGLWNGHESPELPSWYNQEWFDAAFKEFFDVVAVEQIAENRVLYVGQLRHSLRRRTLNNEISMPDELSTNCEVTV